MNREASSSVRIRRIAFVGLETLLISSVLLARPISNYIKGCAIERSPVSSMQTKPSVSVEFKLLALGDGTTDDGVGVATKTFVASDHKKLVEYYIDFPGPLRAAQQVQIDVAAPGSKVLEREANLDKHGNKIGERVLLQSDSSVPGETIVILVKTTGEVYRQLRSDSLQDVLAFERQETDRQGDVVSGSNK
jgi:hypothetical protein